MHTAPKLDAGDPFPALEYPTAGGGSVSLPDEFDGGWGVVLIYRGHW